MQKEYWEVIKIYYTAKELAIHLHNSSNMKHKVMYYTNKELEIIAYNLQRANRNLSYLRMYKNKDKQMRFVFRDEFYNEYEFNVENRLVKHNIE